MKALILNSGMGRRMGRRSRRQPKCMTEIAADETILGRQLRMLSGCGITEIILTTGAFESVLVSYCRTLDLPLKITYVNNPQYQETNYIYSIYCAKEFVDEDILLIHGDLVFEHSVLDELLSFHGSAMVVSSAAALPEKDFKAVIQNNAIVKIGIEYFNGAAAAQPFYKLEKKDWDIWLSEICRFCERGDVTCYAEHALNQVADRCQLRPLEIGSRLCHEIDTPEDLAIVARRVEEIANRTVYMCFSTDILHSGHISIINQAAKLGRVIVGVLSDEAVASYKRFPLLPYEERKRIFEHIVGVNQVVEQRELSYQENLEWLRPSFVVHGDDWREGVQQPFRNEVVSILASYGGQLIEYPYSDNAVHKEFEQRAKIELSTPDFRRGRLKKAIAMKGLVTALEAHSGITGLIAENTKICEDGKTYQFDAMWISSLCDSTAKGKPDIELVDMTSRYRTIDDIMEVTTKPVIFDGDTGGLTEHFVYTVRTLERMGVSMVIIEDKTGLKKNSLFGTEADQRQDSIIGFSAKIAAGKRAQKTKDFMIVARIESLILEQGMNDALNRAFAFVKAGADGIMIHSRKKDPSEVFEFVEAFREQDQLSLLIVVPTAFHEVEEEEFKKRGVNIVIYANHLTRSGFPAMQQAAETILKHHRAKEADAMCMGIRDIISLIPADIY